MNVRRILATAAAALVAGAGLVVLAPASPASADGGPFYSLINSARASAGLPGLAPAGDLASIAQSWSQNMAAQQKLYHNPSLGSQVTNFTWAAENVGYGPTEQAIHDAFMNSSGHRANILSSKPNQVGVGIATSADGRIWVTEVFRQTAGAAAPAPAPAPKPAAAPAPKPAAAPAPAPAPKPAAKPKPAAPQPAAAPAPAPARRRLLRPRLRRRRRRPSPRSSAGRSSSPSSWPRASAGRRPTGSTRPGQTARRRPGRRQHPERPRAADRPPRRRRPGRSRGRRPRPAVADDRLTGSPDPPPWATLGT